MAMASDRGPNGEPQDDDRPYVENLEKVRCPTCQLMFTQHSHPTDKKPKLHDVSVCWNCRSVLVYDHSPIRGWHLRAADAEEKHFVMTVLGEDHNTIFNIKAQGGSPRAAMREIRRNARQRGESE